MSSLSDFPARGKLISLSERSVVFAPVETNYELSLLPAGNFAGAAVGTVIECLIRVASRKVWTVPSGGNFISPIFGPPRIVQGRIKHLEEHYMVVQAGTSIIVELPHDPSAYDLVRGPLAVGTLVNVSVLPDPKIEFLPSRGAVSGRA